MSIKALRGTSDILPDQVKEWQSVEQTARRIFEVYGYQEIRTPLIEETALFSRTIGESTDIVEKQMYSFEDKGGRQICLRPEATASVVRAYLEHAFYKKAGFSKFYYIGPMFRSERPQKGRARQFHQLGVEAIGSNDPYIDSEVISLSVALLEGIGIDGAVVKINSLGCTRDKKKISKQLKENLKPQNKNLCSDCQDRLNRNVFRVLDCKNEKCRRIINKLPSMDSCLCLDCKDHFETVKASIEILGVTYEVDPYLVRGLDYYTRTAFEITHPSLGSQDAVGAGGRYDNLVSDMGGPETGAIGFALGVERLIIASKGSAVQDKEKSLTDVYVVSVGSTDVYKEAFRLMHLLRESGIAAEIDYLARSVKSQMRAANKSQAKIVVIVGDEEIKKNKVKIKDMTSSQEEEVDRDCLSNVLKDKLLKR